MLIFVGQQSVLNIDGIISFSHISNDNWNVEEHTIVTREILIGHGEGHHAHGSIALQS